MKLDENQTRPAAGDPGQPDDSRQPFAGRRVLVTGASRGIAAAIASALAGRGASVVIHYCEDADERIGFAGSAARLAEEIAARDGLVSLVEADLSRPGAGGKVAEQALAHGGPIDSVVLSASIQVVKPFQSQTSDDIERQLRVNLHANVEILQKLLPDMAARRFGRILTIGSVQEVAPSAAMPIYSLTKAALRNLVENLAIQFGGDGITVNALSPGLIDTDRLAFRRENPAEWVAFAKAANAVGRAGLAEEMVEPALFFLSAGASFVTGATLFASGGAHIPRATPTELHPARHLPEWTQLAARIPRPGLEEVTHGGENHANEMV